MEIYFIADTHFGHYNIIDYCGRPFKTVDEMNEALIDNWNSVVKNGDVVFFLGDFALGKKEAIAKYSAALQGRKILIRGNHDHASDSIFSEAGFEYIYKKPGSFWLNKENNLWHGMYLCSHAPQEISDPVTFNIHGHTHNCRSNDANHYCVSVEMNDYKPVNIKDIDAYFRKENEWLH